MTLLSQRLMFTDPTSPSIPPAPTPGEVEPLRAELLELIETKDGVSFADLMAHARDRGFGVDGEGDIYLGSPSRNAVLHRGVSRGFFVATNLLIVLHDAYFVLGLDGDVDADVKAGLPIARRMPSHGFHRPTFLPVRFYATPF
jgi:hypothetical protein